MTIKTIEEVKNYIENEGKPKYYDSLSEAFFYRKVEETDFNLEGVSCKHMDSYGGEGKGDEYWSVYKFIDVASGETIGFIKFDGWYSSYGGAEFEQMLIVNPVERVVTFYE